MRLRDVLNVRPPLLSLFFLALFWECSLIPTQAQVVPDATLGAEPSQLRFQGNQLVIEGGATRGSASFHSFEQFNVAENQSVFFASPTGIETIFSRVTGASASNLDGTLGVLGNADLFLVNPNGILFGPNARLNLPGSFVASTAESIQFEGFKFDAIAPQPVPLLTVSAPTGLNLGDDNSGLISNRSQADCQFILCNDPFVRGLAIPPFETFALVGGEYQSVGGNINGMSSRLEIVSVRSGTVGLKPNASGWALDYGTVSEWGQLELRDRSWIRNPSFIRNLETTTRLAAEDISLTDGSTVSTYVDWGSESPTDIDAAGTEARIQLRGRRIELLDGSLLATTLAQANKGGRIAVDASESLLVQGRGTNSLSLVNAPSSIFSYVEPDALGQGGDIQLNAPQVWLRDRGGILSTSAALAKGDGGAIKINTQQLRLEDGGEILGLNGAFSTGNSGDIILKATESITLKNSVPTELQTSLATETLGSGRAGKIIITTPQLSIDQYYRLGSTAWVDGDSGDIRIEADTIELLGTNPNARLFPNGIAVTTLGSGKGGDIEIRAQELRVIDGATIATSVQGNREATARLFSLAFNNPFYGEIAARPDAGIGNAGNIDITADSIQVSGVDLIPNTPTLNVLPSSISSTSTGFGQAGDVNLTAQSVEVTRGGGIGSSTAFAFAPLGDPIVSSGQGNGGNLTINADRIRVAGGNTAAGLSSALSTSSLSKGEAGTLTINTRELLVQEGGAVVAGTVTEGDAGKLSVNATELIQVSGSSPIQPSTIGTFAAIPSAELQQLFFLDPTSSGDTDQLSLKSDRIEISDGGLISVEHQGTGNAGQLNIDARQLELNNQSVISATSQSGQGGNAALKIGETLLLQGESRITAEAFGSDGGDGGNLTIDSDFILTAPDSNSDIIANASGGNGGNITIRTMQLLGLEFQAEPTPFSDITASSQFGLDGTVTIEGVLRDEIAEPVQLPSQVEDSSNRLVAGCVLDEDADFTVTGRGGIPANSSEMLNQALIWQDLRHTIARKQPSQRQRSFTEQETPALQEAQALRFNRNHQVELFAQTRKLSQKSPFSTSCAEVLSTHSIDRRDPSTLFIAR